MASSAASGVGASGTSESSFTIRPATLADVRSMSSILVSSFTPLPQYRSLYDVEQDASDPPQAQYREDEILAVWDAVVTQLLYDPLVHSFVAVPATAAEKHQEGGPVAFAIWTVPSTARHRQRRLSWTALAWSYWYKIRGKLVSYVPLILRALWYPILGRGYLERRLFRNAMMERLKHKMSQEDKDRGYYYLDLLCVNPAYERRGLAGRLLRPGFAMADQEDRPVWLTSTPGGYGLYRKLGFETIDTTDLDGGRYGQWQESGMRRPPVSVRGEA